MQVIYIDKLFIINFIVNYLILLTTAKVSACAISRWRAALSAVVGAIYSVLSVLPDFGFLNGTVMMVVAAAVMILIVFGGESGIIRTGVIFFAISAAFGGAVFAVSLVTGAETSRISISLKVLLISFLLCYGVMTMVFARLGKREAKGGIAKVTITKDGKCAKLTAFRDTGNSLVDPVTGGSVIVAELSSLLPLFPDSLKEILLSRREPMEILEELTMGSKGYGFFLLPYTAVGVGSAFLIGFRPDEITVDGKSKKKMAVAISPTRVSDGGIYSALVNGGI